MKKFILVLFIMFFSNLQIVQAEECSCQNYEINSSFKSIISKITGINAIKTIGAKKVIKDYLKKQFGANADVTLKGVKSDGYFEELSVKSDKFYYDMLSVSDFYAKTECPINRIDIKSGGIYFPDGFPMSVQGALTNEDLKYIVNSKRYKDFISQFSFAILGYKIFEVTDTELFVENNMLYLTYKVKINGKISDIKMKLDIKVEDDMLKIEETTVEANGVGANITPFIKYLPLQSPLDFVFGEEINSSYNLKIKNLKIENNKIYIVGRFNIYKNYAIKE